jgi:hypothetical protein
MAVCNTKATTDRAACSARSPVFEASMRAATSATVPVAASHSPASESCCGVTPACSIEDISIYLQAAQRLLERLTRRRNGRIDNVDAGIVWAD